MSKEAVTKFFSMLDEDGSLQQEYMAVTDETMRNALRDAVIGMAAKHGCEFTKEDLSEHLETVAAELSEEDLDQVAGGVMPLPPPSPGRFSLNLARSMTRVSADPIPLPRKFR